MKLFGIVVSSVLAHIVVANNGTEKPSASPPPAQSFDDNTNFCKVNKDDQISEACDITFDEINAMNQRIRPQLTQVVESDFFKYFKLNLYTECPFWEDNNGYCVNRACAVDIIDDNWDSLPEYWQPEVLGKLNDSEESMIIEDKCGDAQEEFLDELCKFSKNANMKYKKDIEYCDVDTLTNHEDSVLVDLTANPERFTGYGGEQSALIWGSIYRENCFSQPASDSLANGEDSMQCLAKDAFFRLVSGMHASIGTHLSNDYLDIKTGKWGPNLDLFMNRVGYFPDRVANIYFNYAVVSKAVFKISKYLERLDFCEAYDQNTTNLIGDIASGIDTRIFNENLLFQNEISSELKDQFRVRFKNVTKIMDCVHCDRCRLWGKVQTTGYATSLKILFEMDEVDSEDVVKSLTKYELIALFNTFDRISKSVASINNFEKLYHEKNDGFFKRNNIFKLLDKAKKQLMSTGILSSGEEAKTTNPAPVTEQSEEVFKDVIIPKKATAVSKEENSWSKAWNTEMTNFMDALKFVLRSYVDLPKNIVRIVKEQVFNLWDKFIGIDNYSERGYVPKKIYVTKF